LDTWVKSNRKVHCISPNRVIDHELTRQLKAAVKKLRLIRDHNIGLRKANSGNTRAYVICSQRDDINRVPIPLESLDRWAVVAERAKPAGRKRKKAGESAELAKTPRLAKPLLKSSILRDQMLDGLSKDAKHREAYRIVYEDWGNAHDEILRAIASQTGLDIGHVSRVSHMKKRMKTWVEKQRPRQTPADVDEAVDKIVMQLKRRYVAKVMSEVEWKELVGTRAAPGEVRSEAYASLVESPDDVKKALGAAQRQLDAWRQRRERTDHRRDADGNLIADAE